MVDNCEDDEAYGYRGSGEMIAGRSLRDTDRSVARKARPKEPLL
jgi:hypothetical protein